MLIKQLEKGVNFMDENSIMKVADILSIYTYKVDALTNLLIQKGDFSKDEFNEALNKIMDDAKEDQNNDEYVIENLKKKVFLK